MILIDMEMPKSCCECKIKQWDIEDDFCPFTGIICLNIGRQNNCPLVELPPHGDLIDRDALGEFPYNMDFCDGGEADEWVQMAPVIIPAEPAKEET